MTANLKKIAHRMAPSISRSFAALQLNILFGIAFWSECNRVDVCQGG
jgi:hypothetical protein